MSKPIASIRPFIKETAPYPEVTAESLSERELEVLQWLTSGASNREISQGLYISESTVKRHVYHIFGKLNVCNRTQAALRARQLGINPQLNFLRLWEGAWGKSKRDSTPSRP